MRNALADAVIGCGMVICMVLVGRKQFNRVLNEMFNPDDPVWQANNSRKR